MLFFLLPSGTITWPLLLPSTNLLQTYMTSQLWIEVLYERLGTLKNNSTQWILSMMLQLEGFCSISLLGGAQAGELCVR